MPARPIRNPFLGPEAIATARGVVRRTLTSFALIEAPATAASLGGGANTGAQTWAPVPGGTAVECALAPLSGGNVSSEAQQAAALDRWRVRFDYCAPAIGPGYRLTVTGVDAGGAAWTRRVIVIGEHNPRTVSAARVYVCEDVGPGAR